jgi:hypothetical protein
MLAALYIFVQRTKVGKAMQAVSEDKDTAALMGIDVDRIIVITFLVGGALAGAAGVFYALLFRQVHFFMGFFPGLKAFTAAVLGGIGNVTGAMLGGMFLGIAESLFPNLVLDGLGIPAPYQLKDALAFPDAGPDPDLPADRHPRRASRRQEGMRCRPWQNKLVLGTVLVEAAAREAVEIARFDWRTPVKSGLLPAASPSSCHWSAWSKPRAAATSSPASCRWARPSCCWPLSLAPTELPTGWRPAATSSPPAPWLLASGAIAGLVTSVMLALLVLLGAS